MTKKHILFLLLPSGLFVCMAATLLFHADALLPDAQHEQRTQRQIDGLVRRAQSGEFGPQPDKLVGILSNSWRANGHLHETLAQGHAQISRITAYSLIAGILLQIYVVFRVKAGCKKAP